jgi:hypothetical protein
MLRAIPATEPALAPRVALIAEELTAMEDWLRQSKETVRTPWPSRLIVSLGGGRTRGERKIALVWVFVRVRSPKSFEDGQ